MKVLFVCNNNIMYFPFLRKYINIINSLHYEYEVFYWDRKCLSEEDDKYTSFSFNMENASKIKKINGYLKYRKALRNVVKRKDYDFLICFNTQTALLISELIKDKDYIFDYRDESYEKYSFYRKKVEKIILNSKITTMSSMGYLNLFQNDLENKVILCHNNKYKKIEEMKDDNNNSLINVSFWGIVRHSKYFIKIIESLQEDKRFVLHFYGFGETEELKHFIHINSISNVIIHGKYEEQDLLNIIQSTDILMNCYPNDTVQKHSLTCKLYEGVAYQIPMLIQDNSYMANYLEQFNYPYYKLNEMGIDLGTKIYEWYSSISKEELHAAAVKFYEEVNKSQVIFEDKVREILGGNPDGNNQTKVVA